MLIRPRRYKPLFSPLLRLALLWALALVVVWSGAGRALAVQPGRWVHTTESDFDPGDAQGTVVTNLGDIRLAAKSRVEVKLQDPGTIVYDIQRVGGVTYAAAGPQAELLRWKAEKAKKILQLDGAQVFALASYHGKLLVAVSKDKASRLALLDGKKLTTIAKLPGVRYVWDVLVTDDGILAATGTKGKVLRVKPAKSLKAAKVKTVFDARQSNVLCLAAAKGDHAGGVVYAGTDTQGLVYKLTPGDEGTFDSFVLFDAHEPEIAALLVTGDGTLYAGTADAKQAKPGRLTASRSKRTGRNTPEPIASPGNPGIGNGPPPSGMRHAPPPGLGDIPAAAPGRASSPGATHGSKAPAGSKGANQDQGGADHHAAPPSPARPAAGGDQGPSDPPTPPQKTTGAKSAQPAKAKSAKPTKGKPVKAKPAKPTPAQYDRLRRMVKKRLEAARESGQLSAPPGSASASSGHRSKARPAPASTGSPARGNAVYRIDDQGFSREVFRESVMVLRLAMHHGKLIIATGNEGQIFSVDPDTGETAVLADLDAKQVPALAVRGDHLLVGTANPGRLRTFSRGVQSKGTYTSAILDAKQTSLWGGLSLTAKLPKGALVTVETRAGNVKNPDHAAWSKWSSAHALHRDAHASPLTPRRIKITSPPARFLQYRLTLHAGRDAASPVVHRVATSYITPNLAPKVSSLTAAYPKPDPHSDSPPDTEMGVKWKASDPNKDRLTYTLQYRRAGTKRWLKIKGKITDTSYPWETRRVPDGRYLLRVRATDALDNPPDMARTATRRSDVALVDHTAPRFKHLKLAGRRITADLHDGFSAIHRIAYAVNDEKQYHPILPEDLIADSTSEAIDVTLPGSVKPGDVVTLRASDARGNTRYRSLTVSEKGHKTDQPAR